MYHTLVPQYERLALRREYRLRAFIVLCFVVSVAGILGVVSMLPAYLAASLEEKSASSDLASVKKAKGTTSLTQLQQKVASSQGLLVSLDEGSSRPRLSSHLEEIVSERGSVSIISAALAQVSTSTVSITLRGVAPTRDALLSFKNRLIANHPTNKVDLPVRELAKSTNIQFSIQITEKLP